MLKIQRNLSLQCILFLLSTGTVTAQNTPSPHAEVWNTVETYWSLWSERDLEGYLAYYHIAYSGWNYDTPMHRNKNSSKELLTHYFQTRKVVTYDVSAIDIKIHNNVAVAHYYYSIIELDAQQGERKRTGRKTDFLLKETDKWVIVADHGGDIDVD